LATRTSSRRSARAPTRTARASPPSSTSSATTRPSRPRWASSSKTTWRLQPDVCDFVSEVFYEGRLKPEPGNRKQGIGGTPPLAGTGLRHNPVAHQRNAARSSEEAGIVAKAVETLLKETWTDTKSKTRRIKIEDILVVAPYNAQVGETSALVRSGPLLLAKRDPD
jgi:hypothetical protein